MFFVTFCKDSWLRWLKWFSRSLAACSIFSRCSRFFLAARLAFEETGRDLRLEPRPPDPVGLPERDPLLSSSIRNNIFWGVIDAC